MVCNVSTGVDLFMKTKYFIAFYPPCICSHTSEDQVAALTGDLEYL